MCAGVNQQPDISFIRKAFYCIFKGYNFLYYKASCMSYSCIGMSLLKKGRC